MFLVTSGTASAGLSASPEAILGVPGLTVVYREQLPGNRCACARSERADCEERSMGKKHKRHKFGKEGFEEGGGELG